MEYKTQYKTKTLAVSRESIILSTSTNDQNLLDNQKKSTQVLPNYLKKRSSLSSFLLT